MEFSHFKYIHYLENCMGLDSGCAGWTTPGWDSKSCRTGVAAGNLASVIGAFTLLLTIPKQGSHNAAIETSPAICSQLPAILQFMPPCSRVIGLCHHAVLAIFCDFRKFAYCCRSDKFFGEINFFWQCTHIACEAWFSF